jgi:tetratricopeptide (TPR) repeat protein
MPLALPIVCGLVLGIVSPQAPAPAALQERIDRVRADLFARAEHVDDDVRELKEVLAIEPRSAEAHTLLGIAYSTIGTRDLKGEAIAEFRQALDLQPALVPVHFYLARLYLDIGRQARARDELEAGLAQAPGHPEFLTLLGETERQMKNPARAEDLLRQALRADDSFAQAHYFLGLTLLDLGKRDAAIAELEGVVRTGPPIADAYLTLGTAYLTVGRVTDAVETLSRGSQLQPSRSDLHIALAGAYRRKGLLAKAEAELALGVPKPDAAAASSGYPYQQVELDYQMERGMIALQRGQLAAAADAFKKVLAFDPTHAEATRELAAVNRRLRLKKSGGPR